MYLHLGENVMVKMKNVVGVFDIENTTVTKNTKLFLDNASKKNKVINVSSDMPKSFIVCVENKKESVFISPISASTLKKRLDSVNRFLADA